MTHRASVPTSASASGPSSTSSGYTPNRAARSLVTRRSDSIAVVITQPPGQVFSDPFFPRLLRGISSTLAARDQQLILMMPESAGEEHRAGDYLTAGHVDGALLVSLHEADQLPVRLTAARVPIVLVGRPPKGSRVSYVDADNRQGAQSAVAHLIDSGRRVIATITGVLDTAPGIDRRQGYRDALIEAGLKPDRSLEALGEFTREGASAAMTHLLDAHPEIDGVFAASDQMAAARHGSHPGVRATGARLMWRSSDSTTRPSPPRRPRS